ncbi:MAG: hypothetical protein WAX04_01405, partial [Oscillospiraceae bacterium]
GTDVASAVDLTLNKPTDYLDGVIATKDTVITRDNKVIKVLYTKIPPAKTTYTVNFYKDDETSPFKTFNKNGVVGGIGEVTNEEIGNALATIKGYQLGENLIFSIVLTATAENNVISVFFVPVPIVKGDVAVIHNYFLNGVLQNALKFTESKTVDDGSAIDTTLWQKLINGYLFKDITITGKLKKVIPVPTLEPAVAQTTTSELIVAQLIVPEPAVSEPSVTDPAPVAPPVSEPATPPTDLPETITSNEKTFVYDARYDYTVTINYSKTVETPRPDPTPSRPDPVEPVAIVEPEVPLGKLPEDIVSIIDETVPLGKLPKSGGMTATSTGMVAVLALILSVVLKLKKKED